MGKAKPVGFSLIDEDLAWVDARAAELRLRGGRSEYLRMLIDYDRQMGRLKKTYHESDGGVHFYPETAHYPHAAAAEAAAAFTAKKKSGSTREDGGRRGAGAARLPGSEPGESERPAASA